MRWLTDRFSRHFQPVCCEKTVEFGFLLFFASGQILLPLLCCTDDLHGHAVRQRNVIAVVDDTAPCAEWLRKTDRHRRLHAVCGRGILLGNLLCN